MKSSLFSCCMALLAFAALNMLTPSEAFAQDGGAPSAESLQMIRVQSSAQP